MLRELKLLSKQLNWIGLSVKASHVDLMIRSIAGDNQQKIDGEIEIAIGELIRTMGQDNGSDEISNLLMLHGDYTKFLSGNTVEATGNVFYIKDSNGSRVTELTATPEKAVALLMIKKGYQ